MQSIDYIEIEWEEGNELCCQVDVVVLVKNKLMIHNGHGVQLQLDSVTTTSLSPMVLDLCYHFRSDSVELIEANKKYQIGGFYRIKGEINLCLEMEDGSITIYEPQYKRVSCDMLPRKFIELLVSYLGEDDLCYDYMGADHMQIQYRKADLFPWLKDKTMKV